MNENTLTQPGIFATGKGIIINIPSKLLSRLWPVKIKNTEKRNAKAVLKALDKAKGILSPTSPDGVSYENQIRQEAEDHFRKLNW